MAQTNSNFYFESDPSLSSRIMLTRTFGMKVFDEEIRQRLPTGHPWKGKKRRNGASGVLVVQNGGRKRRNSTLSRPVRGFFLLSGTTVPEDRESESGQLRRSGGHFAGCPLLARLGHVALSSDGDEGEARRAKTPAKKKRETRRPWRALATRPSRAISLFGVQNRHGPRRRLRTSCQLAIEHGEQRPPPDGGCLIPSPDNPRLLVVQAWEAVREARKISNEIIHLLLVVAAILRCDCVQEKRFAFNTRGHPGSENVRGLHELQGRELRGHRAAVDLDFRRRDRKRVLRGWHHLHRHQEGPGARESVVRVWQGDRELASARESCQTLKSVVVVLLSTTPSNSAANHEPLELPFSKTSSKPPLAIYEESDTNSTNTTPIETLFIPENPNEYKETLLYVRELFEQVGHSIDYPSDQGVPVNSEENAADGTTGEDQPSKLEDFGERNSLGGDVGEKRYAQKNPGGIFPRTTVGDDREDQVVPMERNKHDSGYDESNEPSEEDILEAANFGLNAMEDLYDIKEPMLYSKGLYLTSDNPARHVAVFNDQTDEARTLAKYGFAVLQSSAMFKRKFPNASMDLLPSRRSQRNPLQRGCPNRGIPDCPLASLRYRTSDGSCNNLQHLWWGSAMSTMQRFLPPVYDDGIQSVRRSVSGKPLPSARRVTTMIHEDKNIPLASVTHMLMQWGQFVDHDLTATGQSRGFNGSVPQCCLEFGAAFQPAEFMHPECLPISVNEDDDFFGPLGVRCLEFTRSGSAPAEDCVFGPREQLSQVTSYLDASTVYSSNPFQSDTLRLFRNGLLRYGRIQSQRPVLPKLDSDLCKRGSLSTSCFRAGDGRLGEQPALTSLHVAFLRLHNRIATKLAALNAHWSDEKLFQESRRIVGAIVQHITYREYLPIVLGQDVMKIFGLELLRKGYFEDYDPTVNPTIVNSFSTAAYRFGHSLVQKSFVRFDSNHEPIFNNVSIHDELTNPANLETAGSVDRLLLGLINQPAQRRDEYVSDELTNHLFQTPSFPFGMDLASINIQRGRDHGIPPYVQWREPCGLSSIRDFDDLDSVMPPSAARKFRLVYSSVEDIDLFSAGLAEKSVKGGLVGPTFACIIGQQFSNLRRGDRFWYENSRRENNFTPGQLQQIRRVTLAQVLCATMDNIETIQPFVLLTADTLKNQRVSCNDPIIGQLNLEFWAERPVLRSRAGIFDTIKKKGTPLPGTTPKTTSLEEQQKSIISNSNPPKASIHQQNKIFVKRPLGPPDNVTIVVQNNAINSPVFVNDAIHGSSIRINPSLNQQVRERPISKESVPAYLPPVKPIAVTHSPTHVYIERPYVPYAFNDPSNPNPLSQGYKPSYAANDVIFENFSGSSPRPTLYTYYTSFQKLTTRRPPQEMDFYNYKPQDHGSKTGPSPWPAQSSQYQSQSQSQVSRPIYSSSDNHQLTNYGTNTWQKVQYQQRPGYESSQSFGAKPNSPTKEQQSILNDPERQYTSGTRYTTWSSVSSEKNIGNQVNDQQIHLIKPYQTNSNKKPVQTDFNVWSSIPGYQQASTKPNVDYGQSYRTEFPNRPTVSVNEKGSTVNPSTVYYGSTSPILNHEFIKNPSKDHGPNDYGGAFHTTPVYRPAQINYQVDKSPGVSYLNLSRPKPSKVHSVTIVTEPAEATSQAGYDIDRVENRVTSEIPRPLISQTDNNRVMRPGQYYYEKNVLHRYPDKIEDRIAAYDGEQRYKGNGGAESIDRADITVRSKHVIDENGNNTDVDGVNQSKNDSSDSGSADDAGNDVDQVVSGVTDGIPLGYRTSHWLNPQEDSSLPSALEVPKIPSDKAIAGTELPKPIKRRSYAF
ncbi:uncharacterized protein LOC143424444 [Xylocopa sonorina]|uniref:uncharacterized protein LOC143424444 n=1 Tax=Xylocopa sonorina TaxID=1818115 RepID=UPI00403AD423